MELLELLGLDVLFQGINGLRLLEGLWVAVRISLISVAISIVGGLLFGVFMTWRNPVARFISRLYLEIVRIMPQLVLLFIVFFGATRSLGINLSAELSSIIVFGFWGIGEMGDLVRGALASIPVHQYESAAALGFDGPCLNSLDAVSDRDFCVELMSDLSLLMAHMSRFAEELVLWSSLAVTDFRRPRLSWLDGRCVQGPGTYSPRHG